MLLQLVSEFKEEVVSIRGRQFTSEDEEADRLRQEVRDAMRLDIPSPFGARIRLPADRSFLLSCKSTSSLLMVFCG